MKTHFMPGETLQVELASFKSLRRILIVGPVSLLEEGVARLLTTRQDLEVFHAGDHLASELVLKVAQIHPDVVILCHVDDAAQASLVAVLERAPTLAELRIIVVHLQNTDLNIYQHNRWFSARHGAFFPLVYGENPEMRMIA